MRKQEKRPTHTHTHHQEFEANIILHMASFRIPIQSILTYIGKEEEKEEAWLGKRKKSCMINAALQCLGLLQLEPAVKRDEDSFHLFHAKME